MRLTDVLKEPTKFINPVIDAAKEEVKGTIKETVAPEKPVNLEASNKTQIALAAEINANMWATLIETPLSSYNSINYRLARKKAKKNIVDQKLLSSELKVLEDTWKENKELITLDEPEFDRILKIAKLKAEKDGGKVNESLDMAVTIIAMLAKRAVVFVKA